MENRRFMNKYAMQYGTYMGIFWIAKFAFFPLGLSIPFLELFFLVLTIMVPFVGYFFTRMYRDKVCGGEISFGHAWVFTTFMFMFSALLTSVAHYTYFRFVDNGYIANTYLYMVREASKNPGAAGMADALKQIEQTLKMMSGMRPIELIMQLLSQNVIYGAFFALPIALVVRKKALVTMSEEQEKDNQEENKE
jgi:hypothetical protein